MENRRTLRNEADACENRRRAEARNEGEQRGREFQAGIVAKRQVFEAEMDLYHAVVMQQDTQMFQDKFDTACRREQACETQSYDEHCMVVHANARAELEMYKSQAEKLVIDEHENGEERLSEFRALRQQGEGMVQRFSHGKQEDTQKVVKESEGNAQHESMLNDHHYQITNGYYETQYYEAYNGYCSEYDQVLAWKGHYQESSEYHVKEMH